MCLLKGSKGVSVSQNKNARGIKHICSLFNSNSILAVVALVFIDKTVLRYLILSTCGDSQTCVCITSVLSLCTHRHICDVLSDTQYEILHLSAFNPASSLESVAQLFISTHIIIIVFECLCYCHTK